MNNWKYFKYEDFKCPCCGENKIHTELIDVLDAMREDLGFPLKVNSGYRCEKHNREVGGKKNSAHRKGWAGDIRIIGSRRRYLFLYLAFKKFKRIVIYKTFIHVDLDPELPQMVCVLGDK